MFWILFLVFILLFVGVIMLIGSLGRIKEFIDKLYDYVYRHECNINHHKERLDAHYDNIVTLSRQVDTLEEKANVSTTNDKTAMMKEKRSVYAECRKSGLDIKDAGSAVGVSYSTAKRYEKWCRLNKILS
jgi:hypothetical protein